MLQQIRECYPIPSHSPSRALVLTRSSIASSWVRVRQRSPPRGVLVPAEKVTEMRFSLPSKTGQGKTSGVAAPVIVAGLLGRLGGGRERC